jgi:hypothetical protein
MGLKGFKWYVDPAEITAKVEKFQLLFGIYLVVEETFKR